MPNPVRYSRFQTNTARPLDGVRRVACALLLALTGLMVAGVARAERFEGPPPWRVGGRVGFTLDTAMFPDSTGAHLEVYLRVPPATLAQLDRDDRGVAQMRATVKVRPRGGEPMVSTQEFALDVSDSTGGQGQVLIMRFPAHPGSSRIEARLEDLTSHKRGLLYSGKNQSESAELRGDVDLPRSLMGRLLSEPEFLWPQHGRGLGLAFVRDGEARLPNPDRLFGLYAGTLEATFTARGRADDVRPWRWTARVLDARGQVVVRIDRAMGAGRTLTDDVAFDLSDQPAGAYDLDLRVWQEGDASPMLRSARFSVGWDRDTWVRDAADLADEIHFLFQSEEEEEFARLGPGEQERRIVEFWRRRDPTPETAFNEAHQVFRERVQHANEQWSRFGIGKGMFTDMGRVYIRYGAPSEITHQVMPAGEETLSKVLEELMATETRAIGDINEKGPGGDQRPYEVWVYQGDIPVPFDVEPGTVPAGSGRKRLLFLFVDQQGLGTFTLRYSTE